VTILVPLRAISDLSRWPLSRVGSAISQEEAIKGRQSIEAGTVHNKKSFKIQRNAL
jgi:hypothetical protein